MTRVLLVKCAVFGPLEITVNDAGKIVAAPVRARKFIGQPADALYEWLRKYGGFSVEILKQHPLGLFDGTVAAAGAPGKERA
jgi:hypothetical protein